MKSTFTRLDGQRLHPDHNLHLRKDRGTFEVGVTVTRGSKFSGERIRIPLATKDRETARAMRDAVLTALEKTGTLARKLNPSAE